MSGLDELRAVPRFRRPTRDDLASYWSDVVTAWRVPAVKRGLLATTLLFVGSLTPAYLPQNSPWWAPIRALGWDTWPAKVLGTAMVVAAVRRRSCGVHLPPGKTKASTSLERPLMGAAPGRCRSPTCLVTVLTHT